MNEEEELKKALEEEERRRQEEYDEATKGNEEIRRKREGDQQLELPLESRKLNPARVGAGLAFEVGANTLLDALTAIPGSQQLGSAAINAIAQGIRGGKFSFGEVLASAAASQIPGLSQAKALTRAGVIARGVGSGAVSGAIETTGITTIDEGRLPTAGELAQGVGLGGAFGGAFSTALTTDKGLKALQSIKNRIGRNIPFDSGMYQGVGTVGAAKRKKLTKKERLALERQGQGNVFKALAADPALGQTDDQIMEAYKAYRGRIGDPYVDPKKSFKRGQVTRKIKVTDLEPILKEHPEIRKDKVNEYIQFVNDESKNKSNRLGQTITFLNDAYINGRLGVKKLGNLTVEDLTPNKVRTGSPQEIAEDMSAILNQRITVKTLDNIIQEKVSIPVEIADKEVMQVTDLKTLTEAYMKRIQRFSGIPAFERGHVFAAKNIYDDLNVANLSDYKGNLEPEIARSTYNIVDDQSFNDILNKVDLEQVLQGNRSRAETSDPDKVVARLLGTDYGLRESFLNFVYPQRSLLNKIPADAKAAFIDEYVEEMNLALQDYDGAKIGVNTLDFIRAAVLKKIIPKFEALDDTLIEGLITTTNMVTGRDMVSEVNEALTRNLVNPQEIRRKGEAK